MTVSFAAAIVSALAAAVELFAAGLSLRQSFRSDHRVVDSVHQGLRSGGMQRRLDAPIWRSGFQGVVAIVFTAAIALPVGYQTLLLAGLAGVSVLNGLAWHRLARRWNDRIIGILANDSTLKHTRGDLRPIAPYLLLGQLAVVAAGLGLASFSLADVQSAPRPVVALFVGLIAAAVLLMTARVVFLALLGTDNWYLGGSVLDRAAQAGMSPWNEVVALLLGLGVVCGSLAATAWSEPGAGVAVGTSSKTTVAALPAATALTVAAAPASTTVPVPASAAPEPCLVPPNAGVIGHLDPAATVWIRVEMGLTGIATICVSSDGVLTYVGHSSTGDIAITPAVVDGQTIVAANGSTLYILDCANRVVRYEYPDGRSAAAPDGFSQASSCG